MVPFKNLPVLPQSSCLFVANISSSIQRFDLPSNTSTDSTSRSVANSSRLQYCHCPHAPPILFLGLTFGIAYKWQYQRQTGKRRQGGGGQWWRSSTALDSTQKTTQCAIYYEHIWMTRKRQERRLRQASVQYPTLLKLDPIWGIFCISDHNLILHSYQDTRRWSWA